MATILRMSGTKAIDGFFGDDQLEPVPAPVPVFDTEDVLAQQAYMLFYESM